MRQCTKSTFYSYKTCVHNDSHYSTGDLGPPCRNKRTGASLFCPRMLIHCLLPFTSIAMNSVIEFSLFDSVFPVSSFKAGAYVTFARITIRAAIITSMPIVIIDFFFHNCGHLPSFIPVQRVLPLFSGYFREVFRSYLAHKNALFIFFSMMINESAFFLTPF